MDTEKTYKVIRFNRDEPNVVISTGLTLQQAKDLCNDDDTKGEGWFWGFEEE